MGTEEEGPTRDGCGGREEIGSRKVTMLVKQSNMYHRLPLNSRKSSHKHSNELFHILVAGALNF